MGFKWSEVQILSPRLNHIGGGHVPDFGRLRPDNGVAGRWRSWPLRGDDPCRSSTDTERPRRSVTRHERDSELLRQRAGHRTAGKRQRGMAITADLTRSDLLLVCPSQPGTGRRHRSGAPSLHLARSTSPFIGKILTRQDSPIILEAWRRSWPMRAQRQPAFQRAHRPARLSDPRPGRRTPRFSEHGEQPDPGRKAQKPAPVVPARRRLAPLDVHRGELADTEGLSPFEEMGRRPVCRWSATHHLYERDRQQPLPAIGLHG